MQTRLLLNAIALEISYNTSIEQSSMRLGSERLELVDIGTLLNLETAIDLGVI